MLTEQLISALNCIPSMPVYHHFEICVCMVYAHYDDSGNYKEIPVKPYYELVLNEAHEEMDKHVYLASIPLEDFAKGIRHNLRFGFCDVTGASLMRESYYAPIKCQFLTAYDNDMIIIKPIKDKFWVTHHYLKYVENIQFVDAYEELMIDA